MSLMLEFQKFNLKKNEKNISDFLNAKPKIFLYNKLSKSVFQYSFPTHLEYCNLIWNPYNSNKSNILKQIQTKFALYLFCKSFVFRTCLHLIYVIFRTLLFKILIKSLLGVFFSYIRKKILESQKISTTAFWDVLNFFILFLVNVCLSMHATQIFWPFLFKFKCTKFH